MTTYNFQFKYNTLWCSVYQTPKTIRLTPYIKDKIRKAIEDELKKTFPELSVEVVLQITDKAHEVFVGLNEEQAKVMPYSTLINVMEIAELAALNSFEYYRELLNFLKANLEVSHE